MPLYEEKGGQMIPMKGEIPQEALAAIERADEATIIKSLTGEFGAENFMYSYPIKGGHVYGIGTDGAKEIARLTGNVEMLPDVKFDKDSDPDYIYAMVRGRNLVNNVTLLGVGRQCKYYLTEGNVPTDRINEYAFVIAVSKAQRNTILSLADQETVAKIVQTFIEKKKVQKAPPTYGKPKAPAKAKAEDKLKKLRQQIAIEWNKTEKSDDERKEWQKDKYNVDSMTDLSQDQLKDMLEKVKAMQPTMADLGFSSQAEQGQMRKDLFKLLTEVGLNTDDKKKEYLSGKGVAKHTAKLTRNELESIIEEVQKDKETVAEAESIPEDI